MQVSHCTSQNAVFSQVNNACSALLSIIRTRKARAAGVIMDSFARNPETHSTESERNSNNDQVEHGQQYFARGWEVHALVHEEPENGGKSEGEPTGEESSLYLN